MEQRLLDWLDRPGLAFAVGAMGAIAEFRAADGDPPPQRLAKGLLSGRGAVLFATEEPDELLIETTGPEGGGHGHGHGEADEAPFLTHSVSLPSATARLGARATIAELGPDTAAARPQDHGETLFDMGLGLPHVDACVRSADPELVALLRRCQGQSILDPDCPAMAAIKAAGPHRVFASRLARIEVYQPIPSRARGERTPPGPHTHVLPPLLRRNPADPPRHCVLQCFESVELTPRSS